MKPYKDLIDHIDKITKIKNRTIVEVNNNKYVIKENKNKMVYDYLSSRGFIYFLEPLRQTDKYSLFKYIDQIDIDDEQKALDIIHLMALLHKKTTYYKEITIDYIKKIYEDISRRIMYLYEYYHNLQDSIESEEFFSPSTYMFLRNSSIIYNHLNFCKNKIDMWYEKVKENKEIRVALIHNNLDVSHILESDNKYLISWNNAKKDLPIYDFYNFFINNYMLTDFSLLYQEYRSIYPLLKEEEDLLFILLMIPDKINLDLDEYNNCLKIRVLYTKLNKASSIVLNKRSNEQKQEQP